MNKSPISASPLTWPKDWPRKPSWQRDRAKFSRDGKSLTVAESVGRVREELRLMGMKEDDIIVSTNLVLRIDGFPRSDQREPDDPGAAVYWEQKGKTKVMAIDRYTLVADNLAAIAATLLAMRAIQRHGGAEILDRAFTGFAALPAPRAETAKSWISVLGLYGIAEVTVADIDAAYRREAMKRHPDRAGGSAAAMSELNHARDAAMRAIGAAVAG